MRFVILPLQKWRYASKLVVFALSGFLAASAHAETLEGALARAYASHPSLNAERASVRATDETVPQALSGYRPRVSVSGDAGAEYDEARRGQQTGRGTSYPRGVGLQVEQLIYNGNQTFNRVRSAESGVLAARESLRNVEQQILFDAANAYMTVLGDTATLDLRKNNVEVLEEQLRQVRDRFNVGEVTRTDVAQAEARLAASRSQSSAAEAQLKGSLARYRQSIGNEPKQLAPGKPVERLMPKTLDAAVASGLIEHPAITAALHNVDFAEFQVKTVQGELYPTVGIQGGVNQRYVPTSGVDRSTNATILGTVNIPLYEGGEVYARVRAAKETLGQRRLEADATRDQVRANVIGTWGALEAAKAQIQAAQSQVSASETALNGVREEAKVGQRTTLDVLNAQQELLDGRVALVTAQRDRVVASYQVLQATGRLSVRTLGLKIADYRADTHYNQVKDKLWGLETPDGR